MCWNAPEEEETAPCLVPDRRRSVTQCHQCQTSVRISEVRKCSHCPAGVCPRCAIRCEACKGVHCIPCTSEHACLRSPTKPSGEALPAGRDSADGDYAELLAALLRCVPYRTCREVDRAFVASMKPRAGGWDSWDERREAWRADSFMARPRGSEGETWEAWHSRDAWSSRSWWSDDPDGGSRRESGLC